jgi:hypothetical protein
VNLNSVSKPFMRCLPEIRLLLILTAAVAVISPGRIAAQEDPNDVPLGDVARNLRKKNPPAKPVIDDDNFSQVMDRADEEERAGFRYLMAGETRGFQLAAPDVTCSLSFTANVKSLLTAQYRQMDLPASEMTKLQGKATIEGDSLTIPIFNGTNWHVSELAVALTVIRKRGGPAFPGAVYGSGGDVDLSQTDTSQFDPLDQVRSEKKPDFTVIYRMRTAAPPWERAVFSAPLNQELASGDEWHWALVQAKGYPPEAYAAPQPKSPEASDMSNPVPVSLTDPENPLAVTPQHR